MNRAVCIVAGAGWCCARGDLGVAGVGLNELDLIDIWGIASSYETLHCEKDQSVPITS